MLATRVGSASTAAGKVKAPAVLLSSTGWTTKWDRNGDDAGTTNDP
jgi:hypothetical protein